MSLEQNTPLAEIDISLSELPLNQAASQFRGRVYNLMLSTREQKYQWFLRALKLFKYVACSKDRGEFLESYYALMRYIDDVVDGDCALPSGYESPVEFVEEKREFATSNKEPKDVVEQLMQHCFKTGQRFGVSFEDETDNILASMLFDAKRVGRSIVFPKEELHHHFHLLDIRGTIRASLKVFNEDPSKYRDIEPLGEASRVHYNLRDFDDDIRQGLINISQEEMEQFGITPNNLKQDSDGVQRWIQAEAERGMALLDTHQQNIAKLKIGKLARLTLSRVYAIPAEKCFAAVLAT